MEDTSEAGTTGTGKVRQAMMTTPQPFLARLDAESIRVFLRKYNANCRELKSLAAQLGQASSQSLEPICPAGLVNCVDAKQLESAPEFGMIDICDDVERLTDDKLRTF